VWVVVTMLFEELDPDVENNERLVDAFESMLIDDPSLSTIRYASQSAFLNEYHIV
jgi:hypothetical protein